MLIVIINNGTCLHRQPVTVGPFSLKSEHVSITKYELITLILCQCSARIQLQGSGGFVEILASQLQPKRDE